MRLFFQVAPTAVPVFEMNNDTSLTIYHTRDPTALTVTVNGSQSVDLDNGTITALAWQLPTALSGVAFEDTLNGRAVLTLSNVLDAPLGEHSSSATSVSNAHGCL